MASLDKVSWRWICLGSLLGIGSMLLILVPEAPDRRDERSFYDTTASERPGPIGRERYAERLARAAGTGLTPEALETMARQALAAWDQHMTSLAEAIEPGSDWRQVAADLLTDHPVDTEGVLDLYRHEVARAEAFVRELDCFPLPSDPVDVVEIQNRQFRRFFSLAMYMESRLAVTAAPADEASADDSYLQNHCRRCVPPLAVHETWPGHHVAFAHVGPEGGRPTEIDRVVYHEGWGLYAEHIMLDLGYYAGDPAAELGAWRLLYLRALRAWIDPALHSGTMSEQQALDLYRREGLLTAAAARAEVARHWKDPVLKASYFLGLRQLLALRRQVGVDPSDRQALAAFHRRFLGVPRPIPEVALERFGVVLDPGAVSGSLDDGPFRGGPGLEAVAEEP